MIETALLLFFIIDPFGLIPLYANILSKLPEHRRTPVLIRELLFALIALVTFLFLGDHLLSALHISQPALTIAGAIILFMLSIPMIFPSVKLSLETQTDAEPFIVPLAIPLFAGPSALAMVLLLGSGDDPAAWPSWLGSIALAWLGASFVLIMGNTISKRIGRRGLIALERLLGMLLVAIAVEMFLTGLTAHTATH